MHRVEVQPELTFEPEQHPLHVATVRARVHLVVQHLQVGRVQAQLLQPAVIASDSM